MEQEIIKSSPWLNGKKRHTDIYFAQSQNAAQWRLSSLILLSLLALSVLGNICLAGMVKVQPFVLPVDKEHGYVIPIQMPEKSGVNERVVSSQIGQFIMNSRIRVSDKNAQIIFAKSAYKSLGRNSAAEREINKYFAENPPTNDKSIVKIEIKSIIPLTPQTYQAEWREITDGINNETSEKRYQGIFEITVSPPTDMQNLVSNPLGIYIMDFHIQQTIQ